MEGIVGLILLGNLDNPPTSKFVCDNVKEAFLLKSGTLSISHGRS
jgi:hypothetical protein